MAVQLWDDVSVRVIAMDLIVHTAVNGQLKYCTDFELQWGLLQEEVDGSEMYRGT